MRAFVTLRNFSTQLLLAFALAAWPAAAAAAQTTFTLQIPARAGQPAARVVVTLELSGPPGAATLTIGGTPISLPGVATINGDQVIMTQGTGNTVNIEYTVLSKFCPNTLCDFATPACGVAQGTGADVAKSIDMQFTGPSISAYRLNTYVVGAPAFFCGVARKRIGTPSASLANFSAAATNHGRHPLNLVFVLDQSGSMGGPPPMGNGGDPSKWSILTSSLTTLVNRWEILDAPTGSGEWSGDRIGLVFFSSSASATSLPGGQGAGAFFETRGSNPPGPTHNWQKVIAAIPPSPGGSTALGQGLNLGMDKWEAEPATRDDEVIIVMTDGIQNVAPMITTVPATGVLDLTPDNGTAFSEIYKRAIPMQAIAFGTPATAEHDLMEGLAQQTSGASFLALSATGLTDAMADSLINIVKGDTAALATRKHDTLTTSPSALVPVIVDQSARRVVFSLEWRPPLADALDLQVFPPGMTPTPTSTGATPTHRVDAAQSVVLGFDVNPATPGTWQVRVVRRQSIIGDDEGQPPPPVPYTLSVHFLEERLTFGLSFVGVKQATGDQIGVQAEIGYDHKPLAGLPPTAVRVVIARPGESLGTILHDTDVALGPPGPGDVDPPDVQKINKLAADGKLGGILPKEVSQISLTDRGNGLYSGSFPDTTKAGLYQFAVVLEWTDPRTGQLHREERLEREIRIKPSASTTAVTATLDGTQHVITVVPRDRFGNYLGPGFGHLVQVKLNGPGTISSGPTDPQQKGEYKFTITGLPPNTTPDVTVTVGGVPVGGAGNSGRFRLFFDIGPNFPQGTFGNAADGRVSVNGGLEYFLMSSTSVEGMIGYHGFNDGSSSNPHIWQFSGNLKHYFGPGPLRAFVNAGAGVYRVEPAATTNGGYNVGGGVIYDVNPRWSIEGLYNFHDVSTSGSATRFSTLQGGVRVRLP